MNKLRSPRGFTLTEMLCALAVLALLGVVLVTGLRFGVTCYGKLVTRAEAGILCTRLSAAIKQELRYTDRVKAEGEAFTYRSEKLGEDTRLSVDARGQVVLTNGSETENLIGMDAYTHGLRADLKIIWDPDTGLFAVWLQIRDRENGAVLEAAEFEILRLNP